MKNIKLKQHSGVLFIFLFILSGITSAQDNKSDRFDRREARKAERELAYRDLGKLLEGKKFTLKLEQKIGDENMDINSQLNYLKIDSMTCYFQTEHKYFLLMRQVQGNVIEGKIDQWKLVKKDKNYGYHLQFKIITWIGLFNVFMMIESDKTASGSIILKENTFNFQGHITKY